MAMDNASTKPSLPRIMEILVKDQLTRFKSPIKVGYAQMLQDYVDKLMLEPTIQEDVSILEHYILLSVNNGSRRHPSTAQARTRPP